jgi:2,4-dienoyl-CoA reductase-like NADH-dependent reductase (Old Yellow Enzyme family)
MKQIRMYEYYYTVSENGEVEYRLNKYDKKDLFNILTKNVFHTEEEAKAQIEHKIDLINNARDRILDDNLPERFVKWLKK